MKGPTKYTTQTLIRPLNTRNVTVKVIQTNQNQNILTLFRVALSCHTKFERNLASSLVLVTDRRIDVI